MMPIGLPEETKKSPSSARICALVPHGQYLNQEMNIFVDDLVNEATSGDEVTDPYGRSIRVLTDTFIFLVIIQQWLLARNSRVTLTMCSQIFVPWRGIYLLSFPRMCTLQTIIADCFSICALMNSWTQFSPSSDIFHFGDHWLFGVQLRQKQIHFHLSGSWKS